MITIVDTNPALIEALKAGHSPIHEPGFELLITDGLRLETLEFVSSATDEFEFGDFLYVAVGTPTTYGGAAPLPALNQPDRPTS